MNCPPIGAHLLRSNNLICFPVSALDQMIRLDPEDQLEWRILIKCCHQADTPQSGDNGEAIFQGVDRSVRCLSQLFNRWVGVQPNQERWPEGRGFLQIGHVTAMEDIKNAVGEYQRTWEIVDPLSKRIPVEDDFFGAVHRSQRPDARGIQTP